MSKRKSIDFRLLRLENFMWRVKVAADALRKPEQVESSKSRSESQDSDAISMESSSSSLPVIPEPLPPDPPQTCIIQPALTLIWKTLNLWMINDPASRDSSRPSIFKPKLPYRDEVRTLLFHRELKAREKFGRGLAFEDEGDGLTQSSGKMADALFWLYKYRARPGTINRLERERQLGICQDIHTLLGSLLSELKREKH